MAAGKYETIVHQFSSYAWSSSSDPDLLVTYCWAMFENNDRNRTCKVQGSSAPDLVKFADALWQTWTGRIRTAKSTFNQLLQGKEWSEWGVVGLMELALYTNNDRELRLLLNRVDANLARTNRLFARSYERYRLSYTEFTYDWDGLTVLLKKYSPEQIARNAALFSAQSRIFYVMGEKSELAKLLKAAEPILQETTVYMLRRSDYVLLENGIRESKSITERFSRLHPGNLDLAVERLFSELFDSSPSVASAALAAIRNLAESRINRVRLLLNMSVKLASYHQPDTAMQVFRLIDGNVTLEEFSAHHTFLAWDAVYRGDIEDARARLKKALNFAPKQADANWLKAVIAKSRDDVYAGTEALRNLLNEDPYNENYVSLVLHFWSRFKTRDLGWLYQEITRRAAYYSKEMRDKITEAARKGQKESPISRP